MADVLMSMLEQTPASSLAVGGALVAAAVGFTAVKALGGSKPAAAAAPAAKKKKTKAKASKKKTSEESPAAAVSPVAAAKEQAKINLDDFVADYPDTEDEEAARAEKKRAKRKLKKKKVKTPGAPTEDAAEVKKSLEKDAEDGWATVSRKKVTKPKQN